MKIEKIYVYLIKELNENQLVHNCQKIIITF